jgi:hypothetical protein
VSALAAAILLAAAPVPDGFRETVLEPRVLRIAADAGARVYCARSPAAWDEFERAHRIRLAYALTDIPAREVFLAPTVCAPLERWLRGTPVSTRVLADTVFVAAHEAMHLRGIVDESAADCAAWRALGAAARAFGIRSAVRLRRLRALIAPEVPQCR